MSLRMSGTKISCVHSFKIKKHTLLTNKFLVFDYSKAISLITNVCIYVESIYVHTKERFQRFLITSNEAIINRTIPFID